MLKRFATAFIVFSSLAGTVPAWADGPDLVIENAWVRAMPPGRPMTAAYLRVENRGSQTARITGVSASIGDASLHETAIEDGRSTMRAVDQLTLGSGESAELVPGGMHVMLMGLKSTPAVGESVTVCLHSGPEKICTAAPVQRDEASTGHQGHHKQGGE